MNLHTTITAVALAAFAALTVPAQARTPYVQTCGPEVATPDGATTQACQTPLNPGDVNCDQQPDQAVNQTTGERVITLTICPDPAAAALRRQLIRERAIWRGERLQLVIQNRRLRAQLTRQSRPTVDHAIHLASKAFGVDHHAMRRVAMCESTMRPWARNGQYVGLFQTGVPFWQATPFAAFDRTDPYANALATAQVVARQGWRQWECKP